MGGDCATATIPSSGSVLPCPREVASLHECEDVMKLADNALDQIFRAARTHNVFRAESIGDEELREIYDLMKWGPTSANSSPARIIFLRSKNAKEKLSPALSGENRNKTMVAPVTAIIAYDTEFY